MGWHRNLVHANNRQKDFPAKSFIQIKNTFPFSCKKMFQFYFVRADMDVILAVTFRLSLDRKWSGFAGKITEKYIRIWSQQSIKQFLKRNQHSLLSK